MKGFLLRWCINTIRLFAVVHIVSGITLSTWMTTIVAALVLGLLNAFLKPLLLLLTLPVNLVTLGLFTFVLNGFLFYIASFLVKGFVIADYWHAFLGALVFSIISLLISLLIAKD